MSVMLRVLRFTNEAKTQLAELETAPARTAALKQVRKALGYLQVNPAHPGLNTHEFTSLSTPERKMFEAYAQNQTPGAYRIFWHYGPDEHDAKKKRIPVITIASITPHLS
jgi:hypothetical protein